MAALKGRYRGLRLRRAPSAAWAPRVYSDWGTDGVRRTRSELRGCLSDRVVRYPFPAGHRVVSSDLSVAERGGKSVVSLEGDAGLGATWHWPN